jgi:hypothetical protein
VLTDTVFISPSETSLSLVVEASKPEDGDGIRPRNVACHISVHTMGKSAKSLCVQMSYTIVILYCIKIYNFYV